MEPVGLHGVSTGTAVTGSVWLVVGGSLRLELIKLCETSVDWF